jgi:GNAT superfamily N-acetyltransferase
MDSVAPNRRAAPAAVLANFERLLDIVERNEHAALIACEAGRPVGFVLLLASLPDEVTGDDQAWVAYMAVERSARGRGIGSALLAAAEDEARRLGAPYIALMVTEANAPARALYERAGYVAERRLLCKTL